MIAHRSYVAENGNFDPFGSASERRAYDIRRRHQAVGGEMMLVENDAIETERL